MRRGFLAASSRVWLGRPSSGPKAATCNAWRVPENPWRVRLPERNWAKRVKVPGVVTKAWDMDDLYVRDPSGSLMKRGQVTETLIPADTV